MERCAVPVGGERPAPNKYHALPAIKTSSAANPPASGARPERAFGARRLYRRRRLRLGGDAGLKRVNSDRLGDVLELRWAEIADRKIEPPLHLTIGVFGKADRAGLANAFQTRGDIDAVAHQIAVALLDDVAEMNANPELDAPLGRHAGVALDEAVLHFDGAAHGVDHAAELDDRAVAGALDDASVVHGDDRVDQVAAQCPEPRQRAIFVRPCKPAIAGDVGHQNRCEFAGLGHGAPLGCRSD